MAAPLVKTKYPGIYTRGSRWVATVHVPGKGTRKRAFRTLGEARRWKKTREVEIHAGEYLEPSRIRFSDYAEAWIETYQGRGSNGFRETTRDDYRRDLRRYAYPYFDDHLGRRLTSISPRDIAEWLAWLCDDVEQGRRRTAALERWKRELVELKREKNNIAGASARKEELDAKILIMVRSRPRGAGKPLRLADATVKRILAPLRACLATAREEGLIRHNPADKASLPNRPRIDDGEKPKRRALRRDQLATILDLVPPKHRTFFRVLAMTGLRWGEAHALTWEDMHLDGSTPHVRVRRSRSRGRLGPPKSKNGRRDVPLSAELVSELRRRRSRSEWPRDGDLVFPNRDGNYLDHSAMMRKVLKPAAEEAGVPWAGFHTFRHTCASMLFERGANAVKVQRWLGHGSPAFTLATYIHLLDEQIDAPLELDVELRVGSAVGREPGENRGNTLDAELAELGSTSGREGARGNLGEVA